MRKLTPDEAKDLASKYFSGILNDDEIKAIRKSLIDDLNEYLKNNPVNNGNSFTMPTLKTTHTNPYAHVPYGISPTDVDAKGRFEYQEPEVDEQGTYYGYKVLRIKNPNCNCPECSELVSPRYPAEWKNGELTSDREPNERSMFGIHFTKRPDHPELQNYYRGDYRIAHGTYEYASFRRESSVLVKCALSGTIVETEQGFRAQHAQIIGVLYNGNWQSYQDYQERARPHSRPNPYETEGWRYIGKTTNGWETYIAGFDTAADS